MKRLVLIAMTFVLLSPIHFIAQQTQDAQNIQAFWAKFKAAVAKEDKEGDLYEVFCGKHIFYVGLVDGGYKFTEFAVDY